MQATIYKILPFDAAVGTTIKFNWTGNQALKNRCIIKNNDTGEVVYDQTIVTRELSHTLLVSQSSLENGVKYSAYITVFDKDNNESDIQSIGTQFLCLKTPTFQLSVTEGQVIESTSAAFILNYTQENNEDINSWSITIYDLTRSEIATSGMKYDTVNMAYTFSGFSNKTEYYVRGQGETVNGMLLDTGYIRISIDYSVQDVFMLLEATNLSQTGTIHVKANIVVAEGKIQIPPAKYIDNEYLDVRNNAVIYNEGFDFNQNFSLAIRFYGIKPNAEVLTFESADGNLIGIVTYRVGKFGTETTYGRFELKVVSYGVLNYVLYSELISPVSTSAVLGLIITRENGYYNIKVKQVPK